MDINLKTKQNCTGKCNAQEVRKIQGYPDASSVLGPAIKLLEICSICLFNSTGLVKDLFYDYSTNSRMIIG